MGARDARWLTGSRRPGDAVRATGAQQLAGAVDVLATDAASMVAGVAPPSELAPSPAGDERRWSVLRRLLLLADVAAAALVAGAGLAITGASSAWPLLLVLVLATAWTALGSVTGLYRVGNLVSWASGIDDIRRIVVTALLLSWGLYGGLVALDRADPGSTAFVAALAVAAASILLRAGARAGAHRLRPLRERTLVIGSGVVAGRLAERLRRQAHYGLEPVGLIDDEVHPTGGGELPALGRLVDLEDVLTAHRIDRVVIAFSRTTHEQLLSCVRICREQRVAVSVVPRLFDLLDGAHELDRVAGLPLISISAPQLGRTAQATKRCLDVLAAATGLVLLSPVLVAIAALIKVESRGPVFFRQVRAGRGGKPFRLVKFRSMYDGADAAKHQLTADLQDDVMFKMTRDPRVTRVGRWLRRTSLDELPQLFNVLAGSMSLVGPRPIVLPEHAALQAPWQLKRVDLRPGLTGPWQVYGRSHLSFEDMVRYDYQYVLGWSLTRDLELLLATIPAVLAGRGAY